MSTQHSGRRRPDGVPVLQHRRVLALGRSVRGGRRQSIWQTDRIVSRQPILECMTALAAIAGRTRRIKFGVNVVSLAMRDPVLLAKQCATIDVLSQGRLLPGFGIGSPQGPEWQTLHIDTATRGRQDRRGAGDHPPAVVGGQRRLRGPAQSSDRGVDLAQAGAAGSADMDRRFSAAAVRRTARYGTGWQAGAETPADVGRVIAEIKAALVETGRSIDEDHYGAAFAYRFGRVDDPGVAQVMEAYRNRTGRDPERHFAIGDAGRCWRGSPNMWRQGRRSSSCGRRRAATRACWTRRGG